MPDAKRFLSVKTLMVVEKKDMPNVEFLQNEDAIIAGHTSTKEAISFIIDNFPMEGI